MAFCGVIVIVADKIKKSNNPQTELQGKIVKNDAVDTGLIIANKIDYHDGILFHKM